MPHAEHLVCPLSVEETQAGISEAIADFSRVTPEETECLWAFLGALAGGGGSFWWLYGAGKVQGLSAPGITSGLAALGGLVGGGMPAGLVLFLLPTITLCIVAFALARLKNQRQMARARAKAAEALRVVQARLPADAASCGAQRASLELAIAVLRQHPRA